MISEYSLSYATCKVKLSMFSAPKDDERRKEWEEKLQLIKPLLAKHFVCEKHFRTEDIIKSYKHKGENGNVLIEKHGLLLIDEISLRESISVNSSNLTYKGLVDFGEDGKKAKSLDEKATSGLVLMFQPLADNYTQPIAVFASRGPVKGVELAKLVIQAIIFLENAGVLVHGIISDGAETNRKMWSELGVCGKMDNLKNWFIHPVNTERKVFAFSDTPHLIKCIRNRLCSKDKRLRLDPNKFFVQWKHFEALYDIDKSVPTTQLRVCPKLTLNHLELSNTSKMKVRLATQDCEATIDFCQRLNDLFDALNRKIPNEGVTSSGNDFKVLQSSLEWLNCWENYFRNGKMKGSEFLTSNTAEDLRVTIQSTIDICETLTTTYNFKYILTGRINQDSLEKFFGIIRQAAGANNHPPTPTFLQLYKLLSIYSILKPPASGNCTITKTYPKTLITLSELKDIYDKPTKISMTSLKAKLDEFIEENEWEFDDVVEHDYSHAAVVDCIIYYVTGYL
ncbi:hypothetical protein RF55_16184 [Lasius niger]|uniref:Uncharacterized protein n=1 Tax=Lasius niger TaxID=67767 RepID=A0A0J7MY39_LASNI|nr:hypothetical protein RF55_16184 [Lasius niger]